MRRRTVLGGLAGVAGLGAGAWYFTQSETGEIVEPVTVESIWAPDGQTQLTLPEQGRVSVLEFFTTWCDICAAKMPTIETVYEALDPADTQLVSVTIEPLGVTVTESEVETWWSEHDGRWPVTGDPDLHFTRELGVNAVPRTVVLDAANRVVADETGRLDESTIQDMIETAQR